MEVRRESVVEKNDETIEEARILIFYFYFFLHFDPKFQKFLIQNQIKLQRRCCRYSVTNKVEKVMAGWWRAQNNTSHVTKKIRTMPGIDVYV